MDFSRDVCDESESAADLLRELQVFFFIPKFYEFDPSIVLCNDCKLGSHREFKMQDMETPPYKGVSAAGNHAFYRTVLARARNSFRYLDYY